MFAESDIKGELQKSSYLRTWGRDVIIAIDKDDPVRLFEIFYKKKFHREANLNEQTSRWNYAGYAWTPYMHNFIGDTALHIAVRQKKMKSIYTLLLMDADHNIENAKGESAEDLALKVLNKSLMSIRGEATTGILPCIDPRHFSLIPDNIVYRNIKQEAWNLMSKGRLLYSNLPKFELTARKPVAKGESISASNLNKEFEENEDLFSFTESVSTAKDKGMVPENDHVWTRNSISDIIQIIKRQMQRKKALEKRRELKRTGLTLLNNTEVANPRKLPEQLELYYDADGKLMHPGLAKLPFLKSALLEASTVESPTSPKNTSTSPQSRRNAKETNEFDFDTKDDDDHHQSAAGNLLYSSLRDRGFHVEEERDIHANRRPSSNAEGPDADASGWRGSIHYHRDSRRSASSSSTDYSEHDLWDPAGIPSARRRRSSRKDSNTNSSTHSHLPPNSDIAKAKAAILRRRSSSDGSQSDLLRLGNGPDPKTSARSKAAPLSQSAHPHPHPHQQLPRSSSSLGGSSVPDFLKKEIESGQSWKPPSSSLHRKVHSTSSMPSLTMVRSDSAAVESARHAPLTRADSRLTRSDSRDQVGAGGGGGGVGGWMSTHSGRGLPPRSMSAVLIRKPSILVDMATPAEEITDKNENVIRELSTHGNLKYLKIGNEGLAELAGALVGDTIITKITVTHARLGTAGVLALSRALPTISELLYLDLSFNHIDDGVALDFSTALSKCQKLRSLDLSQNRLTDDGLTLILETAVESRPLHYINLLHNHPSEEGRVQLIAQAKSIDRNLQIHSASDAEEQTAPASAATWSNGYNRNKRVRKLYI